MDTAKDIGAPFICRKGRNTLNTISGNNAEIKKFWTVLTEAFGTQLKAQEMLRPTKLALHLTETVCPCYVVKCLCRSHCSLCGYRGFSFKSSPRSVVKTHDASGAASDDAAAAVAEFKKNMMALVPENWQDG